jgi:integrase
MDPITNYRNHLQSQGYRPASIAAKCDTVTLLVRYAGVHDPTDLTADDVLAWIGARGYAANTRIKYLEHVRAWCSWAGLPDLTADVRRPRHPVGLPKPVSEWDLEQLLEHADGRVKAWVVLGAFCGLRSFESAKVSAEDLEQAPDGSWLLRVEGKGGQVGVVPCPPVVVDELLPLAQAVGRGRLWPDANSRKVQHGIRRLAARVGVSCSSHQLRHRFGTAVHAARGDLLKTQQLMRHRSPATTAGYALVTGNGLAELVVDLPGARGLERREDGRPRLRVVR